jgi:hypothetical protein
MVMCGFGLKVEVEVEADVEIDWKQSNHWHMHIGGPYSRMHERVYVLSGLKVEVENG